MPEPFPVLTAASYHLFHTPFFTSAYGTAPHAEAKKQNGGKEYQELFTKNLRSFEAAGGYPPNQAFIGNLDPRDLPDRPWYEKISPVEKAVLGGNVYRGRFGGILSEMMLYGLIKMSDVFDLVVLEQGFSDTVFSVIEKDPILESLLQPKHRTGVDASVLKDEIARGALPLETEGTVAGCVRSAHPDDINLHAHTILENLASKATAVYTVRELLMRERIDPAGIDYIIETSEEACGDINQRGGGNFAKAVGELCGLSGATGSDVRSFCAGPMHGLLQAAGLVQSGIFSRVIVTAGGTTAKLGMNSKKHLEKGIPVLEDCMAGFAVLIQREGPGLTVRTDVVGRHRIGSGASPQAVITDLAADPLSRGNFSLSDVDLYAPELQNPEITENAGAGNVTEANLKMIAAMAVMRKEIERTEIPDFIKKHGTPGWAPTQGHIPSGVPALGWLLEYSRTRAVNRALVIGKGSLFLGRMTNLFDGVSILFEAKEASAVISAKAPQAAKVPQAAEGFKVRIPLDFSGTLEDSPVVLGLTIPGSQAGAGELLRGAEQAVEADPDLEVVFFGEENGTAEEARGQMDSALHENKVDGVLTFHYPFPIGIATVGMITPPGREKPLFIATTTGSVSTARVEALVLNSVIGLSTAKAYGIKDPTVGFINLEGASAAFRRTRQLMQHGWEIDAAGSIRGEDLLRGNDVLAGTVDVAVCDSLTGNLIMKLIAAGESGGRIETSGSGYGPGIGLCMNSLVGIISRATSAGVTASALQYLAKMVRGNLPQVFAGEYTKFSAAAAAAGLSPAGGTSVIGGGDSTTAAEGAGPEKKTAAHSIEGIDVLEVDAAVEVLKRSGIYAEPGMGCTGPVVMVADDDAEKAARILSDEGYI